MSNNKQSMKLYTEEEVRLMLYNARLRKVLDNTELFTDEYILSRATPIELPSDEEIETYINSIDKYHIIKDFYCDGFQDGAKWMRDKIGGNNEQQ